MMPSAREGPLLSYTADAFRGWEASIPFPVESDQSFRWKVITISGAK